MDPQEAFQSVFGYGPDGVFFCPGRVNLIGEHIDYNGGLVMPCAIERGTWLAVARNNQKMLRFRCLDFPETADLHLQQSYSRSGREWFNYPLGVINEFLARQVVVSGLDMLFFGNIPIGAGLSSSASIEVLTCFALDQYAGERMDRIEMARLAKKVENEFIGVQCGIMDQFAVAMGRKGQSMLLNCDDLSHQYLPFDPVPFSLVVIHSRKERKLAESKYNERFLECGEVFRLLRPYTDVLQLCALTPEAYERLRKHIPDPVLQRRGEHVVSEQDRVQKAAGALQRGDFNTFGELMFDSHASLERLYEVSGKELDTIVHFSRNFEGCIGARMTGAGFGGCAIALVKQDQIEAYREQLTAYYQNQIGYAPEIFESRASKGVQQVNESGRP